MKANSKRKVFGDAVDLLMGDMEEVTMPRGVQMLPVKSIQPFHDHPFHLYEGERLDDMIASVKEHGVLNPVIVQKLDAGYEMLSGHNRWNAAKLAGIKEIPAIVKTDLSEEEAYVYVIETNLMQRSFSDLAISEKAAVLKARYQGKREWYDDSKDGDLLIDIICMANNLVDRDAYIIIGVNEECDYAIQDVSQDANRRNTQMLTDFIRGKKFAGDFRPVVTVEQVHLDGGLVDVIVVHNSINTPYYLKEKYKGIFANNIYVRLQDSNTPVDKSADFHHVEYLWKKRFGMLLSPIEKVKLYLKYPEHWANSPSSEDKKYYKYAPEFTIDHTYEPEDGRDGYEYYLFAQTDSRPHWSEIRICYHQTVLAELGGVILDGGRYFTATPDRDGISLTEYHNWDVPYRYMVKGRLNHLVHEFYYVDDGDEARHSHNEYEGCILIFEDEKEHQR